MSELSRRLLSALGVLGVGRHCGHGSAGASPTAGAWQLVRGGARHRGAALVRPRPAPAPAQQLARLGVYCGAGAGAGVGGGGVLQLVAAQHAAHHGRHDQRDHQHQRRHHHHRHHRELPLYLRGEV